MDLPGHSPILQPITKTCVFCFEIKAFILRKQLTKQITCDIILLLQRHQNLFQRKNIYRGVAKVVSRQFRVLEIASSSLVASTTDRLMTVFFHSYGGILLASSTSGENHALTYFPFISRCFHTHLSHFSFPSYPFI